jgi:predicted nucleic acid-binding protein
VIFVDTSAIYAWTDAADANHRRAAARLEQLLESHEDLLTHNYVLLESLALVQARLGMRAATKLANDTSAFVIEWIDDDLHDAGIKQWQRSARRQVSLVDHISFLVMRRRHVEIAFAFDPDFTGEGFQLFGI